MSAFKQLHVRVAEALGCQPGYDHNLGWYCHCPQDENGDRRHFRRGDQGCISRYDTDWSATGPLIEKYGLSLFPFPDGGGAWGVDTDADPYAGKAGDTPLVAVCRTILALSEAGKLPKP